MNQRAQNLKHIRPEFASTSINDNMSGDERFQNLVLRPISKFQNDLLVAVFKNYIEKHKNVFYDLSTEKRIDYIENAIQKDMKLRNSYKGMVIGHFTVEEYQLYIQNSSALNKRMMAIVKDRLISHIQMFEKPEFLTAV
ncbi:MAG: glyoxalase [Bacteroidia bacterium]|nr:glyoxalase [Bacteroidia bacterium]NND25450.1 glyoxalase [Flavobacteriaceae bacterium]MBT8278946.1 glyoxalase [Bacteroidia bacterium]NNK60620.1 glyoxalase [Flavobacteriaceae bacterium]NNL32170.1 glyoxalase [Flavobacteriaceae bacterium]